MPTPAPTLAQILGGTPTGECNYKQGDFAGEYTVELKLPEKSKWNKNYSISSKNSKLIVSKATLDLTWQTSTVFTGKAQYPNITYTGQYGQDTITFTVVAYTDSQHTQVTTPIDPGEYYCTATIDGTINQKNYAIKTDEDKATFTINESPTGKTPKAVLTSGSVFDPNYTLNFVYDENTYEPGKDGVVACYDVIDTSYSVSSSNANSVYPLWHEDDDNLKKINKAVFQESFKDFQQFSSGPLFNSISL